MLEPTSFDDSCRELRELIARMENQHREYMRPYYEALVRYESMRLPARTITIEQYEAVADIIGKQK